MKYLTLLGRGASIFAISACAAGLVAACSSDDSSTSPVATPAADGSTTDPIPEPDASSGLADAGGEVIAEGGGLLPEDPDAGPDTDAGVDAGPACGPVLAGGYSPSTCSNRVATFTGGALTTTTYTLSSVTVLGTSTFCSSTFTTYDHRGGLKVTATSPSAATFELIDGYRKPVIPFKLPTSYRYDAQVAASGTLLTYTAGACATKPAPATASYSVGVDNGRKTIILRLPYGTGTALYRFVETLVA